MDQSEQGQFFSNLFWGCRIFATAKILFLMLRREIRAFVKPVIPQFFFKFFVTFANNTNDRGITFAGILKNGGGLAAGWNF